MRIPKLREGTYFPDEILKPYLRVNRAMAATIAGTYKLGLSQSEIEKAAAKLKFGELNLSTISQMRTSLDVEVKDFRQVHLKDEYPYLWLDATISRVASAIMCAHRLSLPLLRCV